MHICVPAGTDLDSEPPGARRSAPAGPSGASLARRRRRRRRERESVSLDACFCLVLDCHEHKCRCIVIPPETNASSAGIPGGEQTSPHRCLGADHRTSASGVEDSHAVNRSDGPLRPGRMGVCAVIIVLHRVCMLIFMEVFVSGREWAHRGLVRFDSAATLPAWSFAPALPLGWGEAVRRRRSVPVEEEERVRGAALCRRVL